MKKIAIFGMASLAALFSACTQQPANTYTVKGTISGLNEGDTLLLVPGSLHHNEPAIAKTVVNGGQFVFEGTIDEPRSMNIMVKDSYGTAKLMLESATIEVTGVAKASKAHDGTPLYHYDVKVIGSPMTDKFYSLTAVRDTMNKIRDEWEFRHREVMRASNKAYAAKDTKAIEELKKTEAHRLMLKEDSEFFHLVETSYAKVIMDNKDSFWGPLLMLELSAYLTPDQKETYEALSQEAKDSYYGKAVKEELYPAGTLGQPVKPFTVKDAEGKEVTLASLLEGKKYVLIDFWASWCAPCRKEIPNLKNLYASYKDKGFDIISISIDKNEAEWQKALKEEKLEWRNFRDNQVADLYKVKSVPTMYLIDANSLLVGTDLRGEALAKKLEEVFR